MNLYYKLLGVFVVLGLLGMAACSSDGPSFDSREGGCFKVYAEHRIGNQHTATKYEGDVLQVREYVAHISTSGLVRLNVSELIFPCIE